MMIGHVYKGPVPNGSKWKTELIDLPIRQDQFGTGLEWIQNCCFVGPVLDLCWTGSRNNQ